MSLQRVEILAVSAGSVVVSSVIRFPAAAAARANSFTEQITTAPEAVLGAAPDLLQYGAGGTPPTPSSFSTR